MATNVSGEIKGDLLVLTINLKETPFVSNSEAAKAEKEGRKPKAAMIATTAGFTSYGPVKVSLNVMT